MSWFRVDDKAHGHLKFLRSGLEAVGLWAMCGSYSADHSTDGFISFELAARIAGSKRALTRLAARLVEAGLWDTAEGGWQFHDFLHYNPSRAEVMDNLAKVSAARAEAGRIGGRRSAESRASKAASNGQANPKQTPSTAVEAKRSPVPSRPFPSQEEIPIAPLGESGRPANRSGEVAEVYAHYLEAKKRHNPKARGVAMQPKDGKVVRELLARGLSVADLKLACDGLFLDPFYRGENDRQTTYLDFRYALRSPEKFIALAESAPPDPNRPGFIDGLPLLRLPNRDDFIPKPGQALDMTGLFPAEDP